MALRGQIRRLKPGGWSLGRLPLVFTALVAVVVAVALFAAPPPAHSASTFRIIDIRAENGHLIVEAQHFNPDGAHWFYENYTFQGREQYKQPRVVDQLGNSPKIRLFLKSDGREAPTRLNADGDLEHYLPEGAEWLRYNRPHLDDASILSVIQSIHARRTASGWSKGQYRLTTHPLDYTAEDAAGAVLLASRFGVLKETAYFQDSKGTLLAYNQPLPPFDPYISRAWGTVSTFFPDAHPETDTVDGHVANVTAAVTWATIHDAATGTSGDAASATVQPAVVSHADTDRWTTMNRGVFLFDTSSIPDSDGIDSATFEIVVTSVTDDFTDSYSFTTSTPASDDDLVSADYDQFGTTRQATDVTLASLTADSATYNTFTLNATGRGNISLTSITKFALRFASDLDNSEPTWSASNSSAAPIASAEEVLSGDRRPRLVVTHNPPSADITGTIGDGATEQEVRDGGGTIIVTLTGDTWVAAGGTFDAQRQAIINGLDAADSQAAGWNAEVRDKMNVASVVRTNATVATIIVALGDVGGYDIGSNETITMTVPAAAIVTSGIALTATPTITTTAATESLAITGSLGGSGGTPAEIVAGGETIILTLTNTKWVASGATFNAERQAIIDNLAASSSDQNGWNNRRVDFAVGEVVRTSDTAVTITLSASSAYAVPATETITVTAPASALVYVSLTGLPTFDIVASFKSSGNRVTAAIDLSSVTDVAFCAIGWIPVTPTNTTVLIETSVNGGATFSTATNGNCPTGITVGGTLAAITDFRIRVTLTTSDSTATPLVTDMALVIQDTTGQALYYQLNTTPGITITDRSTNTNAGTMSFPVSKSGVTSTTGALKSSRATLSLEQTLVSANVVTPVTGAIASDNFFTSSVTGANTSTLPFDGIVRAMATGAEFPVQAMWIIAVGIGTIFVGALAFIFTGGSFLIAGVFMGVGMGVGAGMGAVGLNPGWTVLLYATLALAFVLLRQRGSFPT